mgnify:CR=1 FL=1
MIIYVSGLLLILKIDRKEAINMTKVDIISGFLGAGKTTFIKKLLSDVWAGEKLVLIENEFGEIGIDGGFLKDAGIIEPSGVGKLSDVARAIEAVEKDADIEIDGRITVVDGKKAKMYMKNFGEFFKDQVEHASTIVVSRTQMMTDEKVEECVHTLREENAEATIISTPWDELGKEAISHALTKGAEIESLFEDHEDHDHDHCDHDHHDHHDHDYCDHDNHDHDHHDHDHHDHDHDCCCGHDHDHHHHHHADDVFTSWGKETVHKYTEEELDYLLKALSETTSYGTILRSKGIIQMTDGSWKQFDLVPEEYEVREGQPDYTGRICVIGTDLKEDDLLKLFHV